MIVVMFLAQAGRVELTVGDIALGMALAILLNMGTITVPGGFPVVATLPRHVARPHAQAPRPAGTWTSMIPNRLRALFFRSSVTDMPAYWVMFVVALISCIIIGVGFIVGIPGNKD